MTQTQSIILVHGSGHDSSCWHRLIPILSDEFGFDVHTVTLSGHGSNCVNHFRVTMKLYAEDVCNKARSLNKPSILIGHSMGGHVISMAAEQQPELFSQLIYVAAAVPDKLGSSILESSADYRHLDKVVRRKLFQGSLFYCPNESRNAFYNLCSPEIAEQAAQNLCRQPIRPLLSKLKWTPERLGSIKKSYIECLYDNTIPIALQRSLQKHMAFRDVLTLESDHSPFLCMPEALATSIASLSRQTGFGI